MRPIKFRAWDKYLNKMFYNGFTLTVQNFLYEWRTIAKPHKDSLVLMQFTGLLDKNGKEIYEGDVVRDFDGNVGVVEWVKDGWNVSGFWSSSQDEPGRAFSENAEFEIIGNIYENPELLNEEIK